MSAGLSMPETFANKLLEIDRARFTAFNEVPVVRLLPVDGDLTGASPVRPCAGWRPRVRSWGRDRVSPSVSPRQVVFFTQPQDEFFGVFVIRECTGQAILVILHEISIGPELC